MTSFPPIKVLFVCLGNICRSPAAEGCFLHLIVREQLADAFVVDSAGTGHWHVGKPADQRMLEAAARRGILLPSRARQIARSDLEAFDHILTMDTDNLAAVQRLAGPHPTRATIAPITRYCRRYRLPEVPDPYYGGRDGFELVLDLLEDACEGLLAELRPRGGDRSSSSGMSGFRA
ncbi:MAG: low molecular weight protein-tyrosine-phosphatase [Cyanobacteriota bacterium]|jgi:protein-tyrosine phosphatase|nr:low molecular weight protein-tyrosine-phosphatase [Cyanobacteriota bacterium]